MHPQTRTILDYCEAVGRFGPGCHAAAAIREANAGDPDFIEAADRIDQIKRRLGGSGIDRPPPSQADVDREQRINLITTFGGLAISASGIAVIASGPPAEFYAEREPAYLVFVVAIGFALATVGAMCWALIAANRRIARMIAKHKGGDRPW